MKKYLLPLILILLLAFTLIGNCADWLSGWDQRIEITLGDYAGDIGAEVTWWPATVFLTAAQCEEVFVELTTDAEYLKTAVTKADGTTEMFAEFELFDVSEELGLFHTSKDDWTINANTSIFLYYDKYHADNVDYIGKKDVTMGTLRPLVTFILDDGFEEDLTLLKPEFDAQGEVACAAIVTDNIGDEDYLTWANVTTLQTAGWEILNHTQNHPHLNTLNEAELETEFENAISDFDTEGFICPNLVYPYTESNELVRTVAQKYFRAARGNPSFGGEDPITTLDPIVNPKRLEFYKILDRAIDDHEALETYKDDVDAAISGNGWVIFYLHSWKTVEDDITTLNALIDYIQAAGVDIVTMDQALDIFDRVSRNVWNPNYKMVLHMESKDASAIDVGSSATNRGNQTGVDNRTFVSKANPANATGTLKTLEIWASVNLVNCQVASFYVVAGNNLSTRDSCYIGGVTAGSKQIFDIELGIESGDYLGIYSTTGRMEMDIAGGDGYWALENDNIPCTDVTFGYDATGIILSIYATDIETVRDSTCNNNDGIKKGVGEPTVTAGKVSNAQLYDGSDDYIKHETLLDVMPAALTLEVVSKITAKTGDTQTVSIKRNVEAKDQYFLLCYDDNTQSFDYEEHDNGYESLPFDDNWVLNTFQYLAVTWDTVNGLLLYKDGVDSGSDAGATTLIDSGTFADFYLGYEIIGARFPFEGIIDEFRASSAQRAPAWVEGTYNTLWDTLFTYGSEEVPAGITWNGIVITKWNGITITTPLNTQ